MSENLTELFDSNRRWAGDAQARDAGFFTRLIEQQTPQYLWIGCADSRVPANQILGLLPGDVFVHRNLANVVAASDLNALPVMQYAVDELAVKHIIVVGHYGCGCGGVGAVLHKRRIGLADNWLRHVQDVFEKYSDFLGALTDDALRLDARCELNVLEQALNACRTTLAQEAWARGHAVVVHGWIHGLNNGLLNSLLLDLQVNVQAAADVQGAYDRALTAVRLRQTVPC